MVSAHFNFVLLKTYDMIDDDNVFIFFFMYH